MSSTTRKSLFIAKAIQNLTTRSFLCTNLDFSIDQRKAKIAQYISVCPELKKYTSNVRIFVLTADVTGNRAVWETVQGNPGSTRRLRCIHVTLSARVQVIMLIHPVQDIGARDVDPSAGIGNVELLENISILINCIQAS